LPVVLSMWKGGDGIARMLKPVSPAEASQKAS